MTTNPRLSNPAVASSTLAGPTSLPLQSLPAASNDTFPGWEEPFLRRRFVVIATGRTIFAWGVWDSQKFPLGSIATALPHSTDWVSRHRNMGLAYAKARQLNALYAKAERKAA